MSDTVTSVPALPQAYTLKECQQFVEAMKHARGWHTNDAQQELLLMVEEVGELARDIRHLVWPASRTPEEVREHLGAELVDVLNYVLSIANINGIDLEAAFARKNTYNLSRVYAHVQN